MTSPLHESEFWHARTDTPVGPLLLVASEKGLHRIHFEKPGAPLLAPGRQDAAKLMPVITQLREYFSGDRREFELDLAPSGTPFQLSVWSALQRIAYGKTSSYAGIAELIGRASAVRAVGAANGANPIPVIIPCHRVIGSNGALTGFGGGLDVKKRLLDFEAGFRTL